MLSAAIILPEDSIMKSFEPLLAIKEVEWEGLFYSGEAHPSKHNHSLIFSSPEIIPLICDLLIVMDPHFCNFDYLSMAIRHGCHLFLSDALHLSPNERRALIQLANEGGTYIQIQNDFLFHPLLKKIKSHGNQKCFIEVVQSHRETHDELDNLLLSNLLMIIKAADTPVNKFDVFCGTIVPYQPFLVNLHLHFVNGTVATLTLKLNQKTNTHRLTLYSKGGSTTYNFISNQIDHNDESKNQIKNTTSENTPLEAQLTSFIRNINKNKNPGFSLNEEIQVYMLMEKIKDKLNLEYYSLQ